jgi:methionyl-tRNA formyltransferase
MEVIYEVGGKLDLAISLNDDRAVNKSGRVYLDPFCSQHGIDLVKVDHINDQVSIDAIQGHRIDWLFIIGWSQIAGPAVLHAPTQGVLGIHPTLLPEGRGRAPIPWAINKGLKRTGVTLFKLDEGVDTGDIAAQEVLPIASDETATTLYERVNEAHRTIIKNIWPELAAGRVSLREQDHSQATVWPGRKPEDGRITPDLTVADVDRLVRGTTRPYPGAFVDIGDERITIWMGHGAEKDANPSNGLVIRLADGDYLAEDYERDAIK